MSSYDAIAEQPLFFLFIAFTVLLVFGYYWGRRTNRAILVSAFDDLIEVVKPSDQTFTNIGGTIGYHANLTFKKDKLISGIEVTLTLLPRQSLLYLPISFLIGRQDGLFITVHLKRFPSAEGHLIEVRHAGFRSRTITNRDRLNHETVRWGSYRYHLYHASEETREHLMNLLTSMDDPGTIRHIAIVPNQKKCFIFMIPRKRQVAGSIAPVYHWLPSIVHGR